MLAKRRSKASLGKPRARMADLRMSFPGAGDIKRISCVIIRIAKQINFSPVPLGWTSRTGLTLRRHRLGLAGRSRFGCYVLIQQLSFRRRAAAKPAAQNPEHKNSPLQRDRQHIARLDQEARLIDLLVVGPDISGRRKFARQGPGFDDPREKQPFVYSLSLGLLHQIRTYFFS